MNLKELLPRDIGHSISFSKRALVQDHLLAGLFCTGGQDILAIFNLARQLIIEGSTLAES